MQLLEKTKQDQSSLAAFCRTGVYNPIDGVKEKHVHQYRRLVYNVIDDTLESAYPLTHNLLTQKEWDNAVQDFFSSHLCQSPQVWYMPKEFYQFVVNTQHPLLKKYPFISELLWFEWLEVELYMMEDNPIDYKAEGDLNKDKLVLNPEFHLQHFTFPVHLKNAKYISITDKADYFLVLHREPLEGNIEFTDLSPALVRMIELLNDNPLTIRDTVAQTCNELSIELTNDILLHATDFFRSSLEKKLILGFDVN